MWRECGVISQTKQILTSSSLSSNVAGVWLNPGDSMQFVPEFLTKSQTQRGFTIMVAEIIPILQRFSDTGEI